MIVVMMGVSGSGKTTIGQLLAEKTGWAFAEGDDYHSESNKQKMHAGIALTDEDRGPWLVALNKVLVSWASQKVDGVLSCSALKESYREQLGAGLSPETIHYVFLHGTPELLAKRLAGRHHEFMNAQLLGSQFQTLEEPVDAIRIELQKPKGQEKTPDEIVNEIRAALGSQDPS